MWCRLTIYFFIFLYIYKTFLRENYNNVYRNIFCTIRMLNYHTICLLVSDYRSLWMLATPVVSQVCSWLSPGYSHSASQEQQHFLMAVLFDCDLLYRGTFTVGIFQVLAKYFLLHLRKVTSRSICFRISITLNTM